MHRIKKNNDKRGLGILRICIITIGVVALLICAALYVYDYLYIPYTTWTYTENAVTLMNPERGCYFQYDTANYDVYEEYYDSGYRVMLMAYDLSGYQDWEALPKEKLDELDAALACARELGLGVVLRAAYHFRGEYTEPNNFDIILTHAEQMSEVINEYRDIVMGVQAGFIGPFGEWHSSMYMEGPLADKPYRVQLTGCLLECLDEGIAIDVRRQMFIREAAEFGLNTQRMGIHNDAFLATHSDMGTYVEEGYDREEELRWSAYNIQTPINGGEMPWVSEYTQIANAVYELDSLQMTYLNRFYNEAVWDSWAEQVFKGQNGFDYIVNHLGYRLSLLELKSAEQVKQSRGFALSGTIKNSGFAKTLEDYLLYCVIESECGTLILKPEQGYSSKDKYLFNTWIKLPESWYELEDGATIKVGFMMTDRLEEGIDERYCIRFANDAAAFRDGCNWFYEYHFNAEEKCFILSKDLSGGIE